MLDKGVDEEIVEDGSERGEFSGGKEAEEEDEVGVEVGFGGVMASEEVEEG